MNLNHLEAENSNQKSGNTYLQDNNVFETCLHTFRLSWKSNLFSFLKNGKVKSVQSLLMNDKIIRLAVSLKTFC